MVATSGIFIIVAVTILVLSIVIPVWVYLDAQKHAEESAALWALVAFFGGPLGLVLYFILGRERDERHQQSVTY